MNTDYEARKKSVAHAALEYVEDDMIVGVGTGTTANYFIEYLANIKQHIQGTVASSTETERRLKAAGITVFDLNTVDKVDIYVDGADECDPHLRLIKGGGGALTREKILATVAEHFIAIMDDRKQVDLLGDFGVPVEVIPMARSLAARQIVALGGDPVYREGFVTDNGNIMLDVYRMDLSKALELEDKLNTLVGVVENGLFSKRCADMALIAGNNGITRLNR